MKIVFYDLETTDLKALMGRVLCGSFVTYASDDVVTLRADDPKYRSKDSIDDRKLVVAIRDILEEADMIVGWNSELFDIPFLNARLALAGERPFNPHFHLDLMWYSGGSSMRIGSKKLDNVAKFFDLDQQKTPITWKDWQRAATGDIEAMHMVVKHCEADVLILKEVYDHLLPYVKNLHR